MTEECCAEMKKGAAEKASDVSLLLTTEADLILKPVFQLQTSAVATHYSMLQLGATFCQKFTDKAKILQEGTIWQGEITEAEVANAETQWLRSVQKNLKSQENYSGFFERMIQNVKRCLRKTLRNARLNYDE